jgi:hypothetical protein
VNYQTKGIHVLLQKAIEQLTNSRQSSAMASVKLWSNLVKPSQTWSNLFKLAKTLPSLNRGLELTDFGMFEYFQLVFALIEPPRFACQKPGNILGLK